MLLAKKNWKNICNSTDEEEIAETVKFWAESLEDIPNNVAIKAVKELSKETTFPPTVHEVRKKALSVNAYSHENWSMRLAWDRYTELGIPLPGWFLTGVRQLGSAVPNEYRKALHSGR